MNYDNWHGSCIRKDVQNGKARSFSTIIHFLEESMSQCCACLSPQEDRVINKKVDRAGRERVYKILERNQFTIPHVDVERAK